jgi:hypothetical protein
VDTKTVALRHFRIKLWQQIPVMAASHRNGLDGRRPLSCCPFALSNRTAGAADQKGLEVRESALLGRGDERSKKAPLVLRIHRRVLTIGHMLPRTVHELAGIDLSETKDVRNLTIRIVERFAKNVRSSLPYEHQSLIDSNPCEPS